MNAMTLNTSLHQQAHYKLGNSHSSKSSQNNDPEMSSSENKTPKAWNGGGSIRDMRKSFEVSPQHGTFDFSLPLETPATRKGGLSPNLALSYSSGAGNGPLGVGWKLSSGGIHRRTSKGVPFYNDEDVFILNGSDDLVPSSSAPTKTVVQGHTFSIQRYVLRFTHENIRVEQWRNDSADKQTWWIVVSAENVTTIYGQDETSQIFKESITETSTSRNIYAELPSLKYDGKGNAMSYTYKREDSVGLASTPSLAICEQNRDNAVRNHAIYLKSICYGNKVPNRDIITWEIADLPYENWLFEVVFDYGEHDWSNPTTEEAQGWPVRKDPFSTYTAGFEIRHYRTCSRVLVFYHMPEKLGQSSVLTSSVEFAYNDSESSSMLESVMFAGYKFSNSSAQTVKETQPPIQFSYSRPLSLENVKLQTFDSANVPAFSGTQSDMSAHWIDLDGEGIPGLLCEYTGGDLWFQRNVSGIWAGARLENTSPLKNQPFSGESSRRSFIDLDRNGNLDIVFLNKNQTPVGYIEREEKSWGNFIPFSAIPDFGEKSHQMVQLDVTGDGLVDMISHNPEDMTLEWYRSLGKDGFSEEKRTPCGDAKFALISRPSMSVIFVADMSGDGLQDVVQVRNGRVSYWPNMGYGHFGLEIVMGNSPVFDQLDQFDPARLRFADIDGYGPTDIVYFPKSGGIDLYNNLSGNGFSNPATIKHFPPVDNLSSVSMVDIFGTGTSCICWIGSDYQSQASKQALYYLDLMGSQKPHVLTGINNGCGSKISAAYKSSTFFKQQDERKGRSWATKLPFPVQCVHEIVLEDTVMGTQKRTSYTYHEGSYDGEAREFAGFSSVDELNVETFAPGYTRPAGLTRRWYYNDMDSSDSVFNDAFRPQTLSCIIPTVATVVENRSLRRALRGHLLREEVYASDGSSVQGIPFVTTEHAYRAEMMQSQGQNEYCSTRVIDSETLTCTYERRESDIRIRHGMVMEVNAYGQHQKSLTINYGREESGLNRDLDRNSQQRTVISLLSRSFTNPIDSSDGFLEPQLASEIQYRLLGLSNAPSQLFSKDSLYLKVIGILGKGRETVPSDADLYPDAENTFVRVSESQSLYRSSDLKIVLPLGQIETFSVPERIYSLVSNSDSPSMWDIARASPAANNPTFPDLGYVRLKNHPGWWQPRQAIKFSITPEKELQSARESFYSPLIEIDALGRRASTKLDEYQLLATSLRDPVGNTIGYENDYISLKPSATTDSNGNISRSAYDAFGREIGVAYSGKRNENAGDLGKQTLHSTSEDLQAFLTNPSKAAPTLLGDWSRRTLVDQTSYTRSNEQIPCWTATIERTQLGQESPLKISITYLSSRGSSIQKATRLVDSQWLIDGWVIQDSQGTTVRHFTPFYSINHQFTPYQQQSLRPSSTHIYDTIGREAAVFKPDATWTKHVFRPWETVAYDEGDLVAIEDPSSDEDVGSLCRLVESSVYSPSWLRKKQSSSAPITDTGLMRFTLDEINAVKMDVNTPTVLNIDPLGRIVCTVRDFGKLNSTESITYSVTDHPSALYDARGALVERLAYDLLGNTIRRQSMDSGNHYTAINVLNNLSASFNDRSIYEEFLYDDLGREIQRWVTQDSTNSGRCLVRQSTYGESDPNPSAKNLRGRNVRETDQAGTLQYGEYDFRGNCVREKRIFAEEYRTTLDWSKNVPLQSNFYETTKSFDAFGRTIGIVSANGDRTSYSFDAIGNLQSLHCKLYETNSAAVSILQSASYNATNQPLMLQYGNGTKILNVYDDLSQTLVRQTITGQKSRAITNFEHKYDMAGRKLFSIDHASQDTFFRNNKISPQSTFRYDGLGRLRTSTGREQVDPKSRSMRTASASNVPSSTGSQLPADGSSVCQYLETYSYDEAGNITSVSHQPTSDTSIQGWTRRLYYEESNPLHGHTTSNRLSRVAIGNASERCSYDGMDGSTGCMTRMPGFTQISWDFEDRLKSSATQIVTSGNPETTFYVYDNSGMRIRKVTERSESSNRRRTRLKETIYLPSFEIFRKYVGIGDLVASEIKTTHIYGSQKIALIERLSTIPFLTTPLIRYQINPSLELDSEANVISYEEYTPFGMSTYLACKRDITAPSSYRYASYERDAESGLLYTGQRYYAPWLGRWMSPDPLGTGDGLNIYAYTCNDPVNFKDTSGTERTGNSDSSGMITQPSNAPVLNAVQASGTISAEPPGGDRSATSPISKQPAVEDSSRGSPGQVTESQSQSGSKSYQTTYEWRSFAGNLFSSAIMVSTSAHLALPAFAFAKSRSTIAGSLLSGGVPFYVELFGQISYAKYVPLVRNAGWVKALTLPVLVHSAFNGPMKWSVVAYFAFDAAKNRADSYVKATMGGDFMTSSEIKSAMWSTATERVEQSRQKVVNILMAPSKHSDMTMFSE